MVNIEFDHSDKVHLALSSPPMKIHLKTYGCQMNERDSEMVGVVLTRHGYALTDRESEADVIVVNTCSVRGKAEDKAIGKLRLLIARKGHPPNRIVGAIGCMVQRMKDDLMRQVPGLHFALGTRRLWTLPSVIDAIRAGQGPLVDVSEDDQRRDWDTHEAGAQSAFINILFGCDRRCTYCIVPDVRGHEWSRPGADILDETRYLIETGVKEITLLGQSVMSYGQSNAAWPPDARSARGFTEPLPRLLEALCGLEGLRRLRFFSGHPSGCTQELARAMAELPPVCEHLHMPLQSGSDRILKLMNRGYTAADYRTAVARLRAAVPRVALTTDVIVGFPTETQEDFELTRALMEEIGFDNSFIFKYNPRPGTPAAEWPDDVPEAEKLRRNHVLLEEQDVWGRRLNERDVGGAVEVLVEGVSKRNPDRFTGRSRTHKSVIFDPVPGVMAGDIVTVHIDRAAPQTLYGTVRATP